MEHGPLAPGVHRYFSDLDLPAKYPEISRNHKRSLPLGAVVSGTVPPEW